MGISTDLNIRPYFDDFSEEKNFHRVLFRAGLPIQARELTQLQTILQNQIERFGQHIFKEGTVINGCNFNFDANYNYVKVNDLQIDGMPVNVSLFTGRYIRNSANLIGTIVNVTPGLESQPPNLNTLYVKYLNTGTASEKTYNTNEVLSIHASYANGDINLASVISQVRVASSETQSIGKGFAMSVLDGIIFQKGHFVRVENQTVIVSKYTNVPDEVVVGFESIEDIVSSDQDQSILDNANGFRNFNAPGANRLVLTPTLAVYPTGNTPENFFSLAEFQGGRVVRQRDSTEYNKLGREFSKRTFEESGDYVVRPFSVTSSPISGNISHLSIDIGGGLAYVQGYRIEQFDTDRIPIRKGIAAISLDNLALSTNYGNYVLVNEYLGAFTTTTGATVNLCDTAGARITNNTLTPSSTGTVIGTARIRNVTYENGLVGTPGATYRIYLFDVRMNAGANFSNVRSIAQTGASADLILESGIAYTYETDFNKLVFPFGRSAIRTLKNASGNADISFSHQIARSDVSFSTAGVLSVTLPSGSVFSAGTGALNDTQEQNVIVVPSVSANSANLAGSVGFSTGTNVLTGVGTNFLSEFVPGDYIAFVTGGVVRRVSGVVNATSLLVSPNFATTVANTNYVKQYPANVPIRTSGSAATMSIDGTGQTLTITLNKTLSNVMGASVYANATRTSALQINKNVLKSRYVVLDMATHPNGINGPWTLGVADVTRIRAIYRGTVTSTLESVGANVTSQFTLDTGQTDNYYGLSSIRLKSGTTLTTSDKLLVVFDCFTADITNGGRGFFSADSYPVDDATIPTAVDKIRTEEIPLYRSTTGQVFDQRDIVDFRPVVANTGLYSANAASASVNPPSLMVFDNADKFFPIPNAVFTTDLQYFTKRIDRIVLDSFGRFRIVEGVPSDNPTAPTEIDGAMSIAVVQVQPYPSLSIPEGISTSRPDYSVKFKLLQNRRFTMGEIGNIAKRVQQLEYYTSLSLLEKQSNDLTIPSAVDPTLDRFKNGIFVDAFTDFKTSDLESPEFLAGLDISSKELIPQFDQFKIDLVLNTIYATAKTGDLLTLDYYSKAVIAQPFATKVRNLTEQFYNFKGKLECYPAYDNYFDTKITPQTVIVDTAQAALELLPNINNLLALNAPSTTTTQESQNEITTTGTGSAGSGGGLGGDYELVRQTTINRTITQLSGTPTETQQKVGDFVTDISFRPYIRAQRIYLTAFGLRPNTQMFVYFDKQNVTASCIAASLYNITAPRVPSNYFQTGGTLTTDTSGNFSCILDLPGGTFLVGEREIFVCDVDNIQSVSASTTQASIRFNAYNFAVDKSSVNLSTRSLDIDTSSTLTSTTTTERTVINRPAPAPPLPPPAPPAPVTPPVIVNTNPPNIPAVPPSVPSNPSTPITPSLTLFRDANFSGPSVTFTGSWPNLDQYSANGVSNWNDQVSSVRAVGGWTLFRDSNYRNTQLQVFNRDIANLSAENFDNLLSSFRLNSSAESTFVGLPISGSGFGTGIGYSGASINNFGLGLGGPGFVSFADSADSLYNFNVDPLAQTFVIDPQLSNGQEGIFFTALDLYFRRKSSTFGVTVEIRVVQNGFPTKSVIPFSRKHLTANEVQISNNASALTRFVFDAPVFLKAGQEYAFVVIPDADNPDYLLYCAEIGGTDLLNPNTNVTQDWGNGVMFLSHNNSTWTAIQNEDIKFTLYRAEFTTESGYAELVNDDYEFLTVASPVNEFTPGQRIALLANTNASGTINVLSGNKTVTGNGTSFLSQFTANSFITIINGSDVRVEQIESIANNTALVLRNVPSFSNTVATFQNVPSGEVYEYDSTAGTLVLTDTSAANTAFRFVSGRTLAGNNTSATLSSVDNKVVSYFQPIIYRTTVQGTHVGLSSVTTSNTNVQTGLVQRKFNDTNFLSDNESIIMSRSNEIANLAGNKSLRFRVNLATAAAIASPSIDLGATSVSCYKNRINNTANNEEFGKGDAFARYVSKTVNLAEGQESEDIKVFLTAYRPLGTEIDVFARFYNEFDTEMFDDKAWTKLEVLAGSAYSDRANRQDFFEFEYTIPAKPPSTFIASGIAVSNASANVTGSDTTFSSTLAVADSVLIEGSGTFFVSRVATITNNTNIVLEAGVPFTSTSATISKLTNPNGAFGKPQNSGIVSYINSRGAQFDGYKSFAIKVVLRAETTNLTPRVKDLRVIALSI